MTYQAGWQPERTWVFIVGTLEWKHRAMWDSFPKRQRRDRLLAEFFRAQRVPEERIVYLQDDEATTARIAERLAAQLSAAAPGDLLVLYYCGHGHKEDDGAAYFASYDAGDEGNPGWEVEAIPAAIERHFGGSRALLLADCCYSGCLGDAAARQARRVGYACLTSSLASELSTGNWTFTEGLLAGLQGHCFTDGDGNSQITLGELAAQLIESMAFAEEQVATFTVAGGFDPGLVVAPARPRPHPRVGQQVEVRAEGGWYPAQIIDADGERFRVHYYGYDPSDDEWVDEARIRQAERPTYAAGTPVEVKWKRSWYPATVKDIRSGVHYIQYDDFDAEWNEWVALKRIRPRRG